MANEEHLRILRQGVDVWNQWRKENVAIIPDLSKVNLSKDDLSETNLSQAILFQANLSYANLFHVTLSDTDLSHANLSYANLFHANLSGANLYGADLNHANLSDADLSQVNLSDADLSYAILSYATPSYATLFQTTLSYADLSQANLFHADLSQATLIQANLFHADLSQATLIQANLFQANLSQAKLINTNLSHTNLNRTDLTDTLIGGTVFGNVDLGEVKGLESIIHHGPSTIGIDTITKSQGKIPEVFLKGAGVPDVFIAYMQSLTSEAIKFYSCFISYSSKDKDLAERLYNDLQAQGVRCWFAPEDLKWGAETRQGIDDAIRFHDKLLLILSKHSVESNWVQKEVETAFEEETLRKKQKQKKATVLFPIRIDPAVMKSEYAWAADIRRMRNIGDFTKWKDHDTYQKAFDRLLRDLKAEASNKA